MAKVRHLNAPRLNNPYAGYDNLANSIYKTSQNVLDRHEREDVRAENNIHKNKVFDRGVLESDRNFKHAQNLFDYKIKKDREDMFYKKGRDKRRDYEYDNTFAFKKEHKPKTLTPLQELTLYDREQKRIATEDKLIRDLGFEFDKHYGANMDNWEELTPEQQAFMRKQYVDGRGKVIPEIDASEPWFWFNTYNPKGYKGKPKPKVSLHDEEVH